MGGGIRFRISLPPRGMESHRPTPKLKLTAVSGVSKASNAIDKYPREGDFPARLHAAASRSTKAASFPR